MMKAGLPRKQQQGAALMIGLLLLVVITVLAMSGVNTAASEMAMARNKQRDENAFQAAETGLEFALAQEQFDTLGATELPVLHINSQDTVNVQIEYEAVTALPDEARSPDIGSEIFAHHFLATARGVSRRAPGSATDRDSVAVHTQAFYVIGPEAPADTIAVFPRSETGFRNMPVRTLWTRKGVE